MINVKVATDAGVTLPEYKTKGAAGCDVHARNGETIKPGEWKVIHTGMRVAIPDGFEIQIRPRSGFAMAKGVTVLNSPGTIDSDYRGFIGVMLINHGKETVDIKAGDRIAQLVLCPVYQIEWEQVESLDDTKRGGDGFGSTGK